MDLQITKSDGVHTLSQFGLWVQDVMDSTPSIEHNFRRVWGKSARVNAGATYAEKMITAVGKAIVADVRTFEDLKDTVNGLVVDIEPFYVHKMLPDDDGLYDYENPGETTGELNFIDVPHTLHKYRWKVVSSGQVDWRFIGKYQTGMLYEFTMDFITVEIPFGETVPVTLPVGTSIQYKGNTPNSQLESPWAVQLTATAGQPGTFSLKIGEQTYTHTTSTPVDAGDVFVITGISTHLNDTNVTHRTNYGHFVLKPGSNAVTTTFVGDIAILDYKELYK